MNVEYRAAEVLAEQLDKHRYYGGMDEDSSCSCGVGNLKREGEFLDHLATAQAAALAAAGRLAGDREGETVHMCGHGCQRCADHDPRDRADHGHLPQSMCPACTPDGGDQP